VGVGKHMCVVRVQYPQCHTNTYNVPTVPHQHLQRSYRTHQHIQCPQCHTNTNNVLTVPHQHVQCSHRTHQHIQCSHRTHQHIQCSQCHTSTYNVQCSQCHTSTYNVHSATPARTMFTVPHQHEQYSYHTHHCACPLPPGNSAVLPEVSGQDQAELAQHA